MNAPVCIVLAGGLGTRLRSAVPDRPKCLAPVGDRPFLEFQLRALAAQGFGHFLLSLGHLAEMGEAAAGTFEVDARIECVVESAPLGTGGAVLHAMRYARLTDAAVVNGDTYIDADLSALLEPLAAPLGEVFRMAAIAVEDRARYGGIEVDGPNVLAFVEQGHTGPGLINAGVYHLSMAAFEGFEPGTAFSMETQVMPAVLRRRVRRAAVVAGEFIDIGIPQDYKRFCMQHAERRG